MSNQGNIIIKSWEETGQELILTTHRWSGRETPRIVQESVAYVISYSKLYAARERYQDLCEEISHHSAISRPIFALGNIDTPTVIVDCHKSTVSWVDSGYDGIQTVLKTWTFEEYLKEDLEPYTDTDFAKYYGD